MPITPRVLPSLIVVVTNDTPAARANVWGSIIERVFSGTVVAARDAVPTNDQPWGEGTVSNNAPTKLRAWGFNPSLVLDDDFDGTDGTRAVLTALFNAGKIRVFLWRPEKTGETLDQFTARWKAAVGWVG